MGTRASESAHVKMAHCDDKVVFTPARSEARVPWDSRFEKSPKPGFHLIEHFRRIGVVAGRNVHGETIRNAPARISGAHRLLQFPQALDRHSLIFIATDHEHGARREGGENLWLVAGIGFEKTGRIKVLRMIA